jgi:hypothetical protein
LTTALVIVGIVAIVVILVLMRLPTIAGAYTSSFRTYRERRRKKDRRTHQVPFTFERRRLPRRERDLAAKYVEFLTAQTSAQEESSCPSRRAARHPGPRPSETPYPPFKLNKAGKPPVRE